MQEVVIIVAAGSGSRLGGEVPKQLRLLNGIPLAIHSGLRFRAYKSNILLLYVVAPGSVPLWEEILNRHFPDGHWKAVEGGESRYLSVKNGVKAITPEAEMLVAIHDGARPFIEVSTIAAGFDSARQFGSGVVAVPVKDSLRKRTGEGSESVDRQLYYQVQTPQIFRLADLQQACNQPDRPLFTDDASVMEKFGMAVRLVEGSYRNFKVTTAEDWALAEVLSRQPARDSGSNAANPGH